MKTTADSSLPMLTDRRRTQQILEAQQNYRSRKRKSGCRRIQEWVADETLVQLSKIAHDTGLSRAQLLEQLVACAFSGKIDMREINHDNR